MSEQFWVQATIAKNFTKLFLLLSKHFKDHLSTKLCIGAGGPNHSGTSYLRIRSFALAFLTVLCEGIAPILTFRIFYKVRISLVANRLPHLEVFHGST